MGITTINRSTNIRATNANYVLINDSNGNESQEAQLAISRGGTALGTTPSNGQLLIGNGSAYALSTLTSGATAGVTISNGSGTITLDTTQDIRTTATPTFAQLHISNSPTVANNVATKSYVDSLTATNLSWKQFVRLATAAALPSYTYNNGTAGVGATLTATANAALTVDGTAVATSDRILVKDETAGNAPYNGIYTVTQTGDGSNPYILTRATDADSPQGLLAATVTVDVGTANSDTAWFQTAPATITVGTTNISFIKLSGTTYTADGTTITLTGNQFSVTTGGITNTQISATAAIATTKLAAQTANYVAIYNGSGFLTSEQFLNVVRGGTGVNGSSAANGTLLIGNGSGYTLSTLTQGATAGVTISNGSGTITLDTAQDIRTSASPTFTGLSLTGLTVPTTYSGVANVGLDSWKYWVKAATTAALPSNTYSNGTAGVGATLTATSNGALTVDGISISATDDVLVWNEATGANNGVYRCTQTGTGGAPYILTRRYDSDRPSTLPGETVVVQQGSTYASRVFTLSTSSAITVGTTSLTYALAATTYTADGTTITLTGTQFSVTTGGITNTQISSTANIAVSKLAAGTAGQVLLNNATPTPTWTTLSGDVSSVSGTGSVSLNTSNVLKFSKLIQDETPSGSVNSSNLVFTLANTPIVAWVHLNGLLMEGGGNDYTLSVATITFQAAQTPQTGDKLRVDYFY